MSLFEAEEAPEDDGMRVVCLGVHVLDVLVRPVEAIPAGQGGQLVEQIALTAAGTAGGTAVDLAKLGATVFSAGAVGDDALADVLIAQLQRHGVITAALVRRSGVQTSASVLPIRPDGSRPAFHVVGANAGYTGADAPWDLIASATHLHLGAPEFMGGEEAARLLSFAREHGVTTSADLLAPGEQAAAILDWIAPMFAHLDVFLPNEEQALALTGAADLAGAGEVLRARGVGLLAATAGAAGAVVVDARGVSRIPALPVEVVDTTGCGDAFSAGFLRGLALGRSHADAARLGCATAACVARGLGSDFGDYDLSLVEGLAYS